VAVRLHIGTSKGEHSPGRRPLPPRRVLAARKVTFLFRAGAGRYKIGMNGTSRESAVKELFGSVIKQWREERLNISVDRFAERYDISDRFVRMIQSGKELPFCTLFISMVMISALRR